MSKRLANPSSPAKSSSACTRRHGFATEGLQRGDLLESEFAPRLL